ncbi:MAG: hypothetical protein WC725_04965 [Patescibacteria group bacterium]|jgi:hypothetical protein
MTLLERIHPRVDVVDVIREQIETFSAEQLISICYNRSLVAVANLISDKVYEMLAEVVLNENDKLEDIKIKWCFEDASSEIIKLGIDIAVRKDTNLRIDLIDTMEISG